MRSMQHLLCQALCAGVMAAAATAAVAAPAYVPSTVNLRAAPGTTSEIVSKIPSGSLVDADSCSEGWCAVTWQGKSGFAIQTALDMTGRVPQRRAVQRAMPPQNEVDVAYDDGPDYVEAPPPVYYGPRPYYYGYGPYYRGWGGRHRW